MSISIDLLDDRLMEGLAEFASQAWTLPRNRQFFDWFFRKAPGAKIFVAHKNGRWLAVIGGILKPHLNGESVIDCYETYAWASLEAREARGLGIKVMKGLMDLGCPLIALGGSPDTLNFMPRLGFEIVASAPSMVLPLRPSFAAEIAGAKGLLMRSGIRLMSMVTKPRVPNLSSLRMQPMTRFDDDLLAMPTLPGFQAIFDAGFFEWQSGWPHQGTFLPLQFLRGEETVGWLFARVAEELPGQICGRILENKFSPETSASERRLMILYAVSAMAGFGANAIRALTTCADTNEALRNAHFRSRSTCPSMVYNAQMIAQDQPFRLSVLRADGGVLPLRREPRFEVWSE